MSTNDGHDHTDMVTTSVRRYWLYSNLRFFCRRETHFRQLRQQPGLGSSVTPRLLGCRGSRKAWSQGRTVPTPCLVPAKRKKTGKVDETQKRRSQFIFRAAATSSRLEVTVTSLPPPHLCRIAVFSIKPTFLSKTSSGKLSS